MIRTQEDYRMALNELEGLMESPVMLGSPEAERLEDLSLVIEAFEKEKWPIALPSPVEAIRFRMEQMGLTEADLIPMIGTAKRVRAVMSGKEELTLTMMRALHRELGIPRVVLDQLVARKEVR